MPTYKIRVKTGNVDHAGTDADVFITLMGSINNSEEFSLDSDADDFERNSDREYTVQTTKQIGVVEKVRIRHDNKGNAPGWFLSFITVRNETNAFFNNSPFIFPCNKWLAKDEGDGLIDRILNKQ